MKKYLAVAAAMFSLATAAQAQVFASNNSGIGTQYTVTLLDTLGGGNSRAYGINSSGQVVGSALTASGTTHAVVWNSATAVDLGTLGETNSVETAINNTGQIVGYSYNSPSYQPTRAAFWNGTDATYLTDAYQYSRATGINNSGQIVGSSVFADPVGPFGGGTRTTVWDGATVTNLGTIGQGIDSWGTGINDSGQVVGEGPTAGTNHWHGAVWNGTTVTDLVPATTPTSLLSHAYAINNTGQIVGDVEVSTALNGYLGWYTTVNHPHATIWNGTVATDLGTLAGGFASSAKAINNLGQVVGYSAQGTGRTSAEVFSRDPYATIWNGSSITDLNTALVATDPSTALFALGSGWVLREATGINDSGQIVGYASNTLTGAERGFLLTPASAASVVPIPAAAWLMLSGIGVLGAAARRRKSK